MRLALLAPLALGALACGAPQRPRAPIAVTYRIYCEPRDARVVVDEVDQGPCLLWEQQRLGLRAGSHRFRIEREGYLPQEQETAAQGTQTLRVRLREVPE